MTTRIEAAREAISEAFADHSYDVWPDMENEAKAALAAADAHDAAHNVHRLVIDDATVERVARAIYAIGNPIRPWERVPPTHQEMWRRHARAVLAAAVQEGEA